MTGPEVNITVRPTSQAGIQTTSAKSRHYTWRASDVETMKADVFLRWYEGDVVPALLNGALGCPSPSGRGSREILLAAKDRAEKEGLYIPPPRPVLPRRIMTDTPVNCVVINAPKLAKALFSKKPVYTIAREMGIGHNTLLPIVLGQRRHVSIKTLESICKWLKRDVEEFEI